MWKKLLKRLLLHLFLVALCFPPESAKADFFGGDIPLLIQIAATTVHQLSQLQDILSKEKDTLGLLRDVNEGMREAMGNLNTINTTMRPGLYSGYKNSQDLLYSLQEIYGKVPRTSEAKLQTAQDQSVSEAITLHNQAFQYADQVDPEAEQIKDYAKGVSPAGAGRLTAQSLGVLIHVSNQILRTNAAMLKILSENLALQNRHEKLNSEQFNTQYEGLSKGLGSYPKMADSTKIKF